MGSIIYIIFWAMLSYTSNSIVTSFWMAKALYFIKFQLFCRLTNRVPISSNRLSQFLPCFYPEYCNLNSEYLKLTVTENLSKPTKQNALTVVCQKQLLFDESLPYHCLDPTIRLWQVTTNVFSPGDIYATAFSTANGFHYTLSVIQNPTTCTKYHATEPSAKKFIFESVTQMLATSKTLCVAVKIGSIFHVLKRHTLSLL